MFRLGFILLLLTGYLGSYCQTSSSAQIKFDSLKSSRPLPPIDTMILRFESIAKLSVEVGDKITQADCLNILSKFYNLVDDLSNAIRCSDMAVRLARDTTSIPLDRLSTALNNAAHFNGLAGNHIAAIENILEAIALEKSSNADPIELSIIYHNLSEKYRAIGDFRKSYQTIKESINYRLKVNESNFHYSDLAHAYFLSGLSLSAKGDNLKAIKEFLRGQKYLTESGHQKTELSIDLYHELARNYLILEEYDNVKKCIDNAISVQKVDNYREYKTLELKGLLFGALGDLSPSVEFFKRALEFVKEDFKENKETPVYARICRELAYVYYDNSEMELALDVIQDGLGFFDNSVIEDNSMNPGLSLISSLNEALKLMELKIKVSLSLYNKTKSEENSIVAYNAHLATIDIIEAMKQRYMTKGSKFFTAKKTDPLYGEVVSFLFDRYMENPDDSIANDIFKIIGKNKSSILIESLKKKYALLSSTIPEDVKLKQNNFNLKISKIKKEISLAKYKGGNGLEIRDSLSNILYDLNEENLLHNNEIASKFPEFASIKNSKTSEYSIKSVQELLRTNENVLEYFIGPKYVYGLNISKSNFELHRLSEIEILDSARVYRDILSNVENNEFDRMFNLSHYLYNNLIARFENTIGINMLVIPSNELSKIPFESFLVTHGQDEFLVHKNNVSYNNSISQLVKDRTEKAENHNHEILCLAPVFQGANSLNRSCNPDSLGRLMYAENEAKYLSENLDAKMFSSTETNTTDLTANVADYSIVHLATHACLNTSDPMLSEIHFNDGSLTSYDIQNLNVQPELVVLSACNSGQGVVQQGEGLVSLTRGFFQAGVKSLQSTLWSIDDQSSSEIMTGMYSHLKKGESRSSALRKAKLDYLAGADKFRSHPYFWASIIHIGDTSPLYSTFNKWYYLLLMLFGIALIYVFRKMYGK